jgi:choline dehydrogenase-like flavoprotein
MREHPSGLSSDVLGRPCGAERIHVVDSSVFPSIASTTIAFTAMANAHRIATEVATLP